MPYEILFGKSPSYDYLRVFGCLNYFNQKMKDPNKFQERALRGIFIGYPFGRKAWKIMDLETVI